MLWTLFFFKTGEKVVKPAVEKKPGFFDSPGAAYDSRAWTKTRFYEELAKKQFPTME